MASADSWAGNAGVAAWRRSLSAPEEFWSEAASLIDWITPPEQVLDDASAPLYRWFTGGELNTCANALDRHVAAGRGDRVALIHDSAYTGQVTTLTYEQLLDRVARFAGALRAQGVDRGDRVIIYLPMVPEAMIAMLACTRLGAVHSVVFGGFAAPELAARIDDAQPTAIITASCGVEAGRVVPYKPLVDEARALAEHQARVCVVLQRPQLTADMGHGDIAWDATLEEGPAVEPVPVKATDPLYILYTSGTTGKPKGIVRDNGGHAVAMAWSMPHVYGVGPDDVWWAASDVGWVVGHSYIVYAPLITGCTTVMYEGKPVGTPDAGAFWRIIEQHGVNGLFTAPTAIRAIKKEDPEGEHLGDRDLTSLRTLFLAGERLDPDTFAWATQRLGIPVVDNWWQTETGWPIASSMRGLDPLPLKVGSPSRPVPGYDVRVLDESAGELPVGAEALG